MLNNTTKPTMPRSRRLKTRFYTVLWLGCTVLVAGCRCDSNETDKTHKRIEPSKPTVKANPIIDGFSPAAPPSTREPTEVQPTTRDQMVEPRPPVTLITLEESAYGITLGIDEKDVYLFTQSAAYRFSNGEAPTKMPLDLGYGPALTQTSILYWSENALFGAPKKGGSPQRLATVPRRPIQIVSSSKHFAWLHMDDKRNYTIQVLRGSKPQNLYKAVGSITALTMLKDRVVFVEQAPDATWRVGSIRVKGNPKPKFTKPHNSRTPSMLAASGEIYYFDLPTRSVLRISPDSLKEKVVANKTVCSPIAVSDRILCARVEGVFEISKENGSQKPLTAKPTGLVTALTGSSKVVAWVNDTGKNQLTLRMLPL